jgi:predicted DsbA family dithiol-disulfide isomerase
MFGRRLEAAQARLRGLFAAEGLPVGSMTFTYNTRLAQELATWAEARSQPVHLHDALFRAVFVDEVNVAEPEALVRIAAAAGLPADEARAVITDRRQRAVVDAEWQRARELGITGVPTYVVGQQGVVGAQPYEQLEELVTAMGGQKRSRPGRREPGDG